MTGKELCDLIEEKGLLDAKLYTQTECFCFQCGDLLFNKDGQIFLLETSTSSATELDKDYWLSYMIDEED